MSRSLKHLLQGRPLGHPLHTMLVHLPIGLWMLSFVLDLIALAADEVRDSRALARASLYAILTGLVVAVPTIVTGLADFADVRADHPSRRTATWHMLLSLLAAAAFAASLLRRLADLDADVGPPAVAIVLSAVGVLLINVSGYLGGKLVYDDGLGAGRHRRTHDPRPTVAVNAEPDADGYVDVMKSDELPDGVPRRVDVNGHVMVLLRQDGQVCAVQEFCTHRCGPLSEGAIRDGKIVCPWHRSSFDVRTGKVTDGPAKVDLKRYATRERDGRVAVTTDTSG